MHDSDAVTLAAKRPDSAVATCPISAANWRAAPAVAQASIASSAPRRYDGLLVLTDGVDPARCLRRAQSECPHLSDACPIAPCDWRNSPPPAGAPAAAAASGASSGAGSVATSHAAVAYAAASSLPASPDRCGSESGSPDVPSRPAGLRRSLLEQRRASYNEGSDQKAARRNLPGVLSPLATPPRSSWGSNSSNSGGSSITAAEIHRILRANPGSPAAAPSCDAAGKQGGPSRVASGSEFPSAWSPSSASSSPSARSGLGIDSSSRKWRRERNAAAAAAAAGYDDADFDDDCTIGHSMAEEVGSVEAECVNWDEVESLCQSMDVAGVQLEDVFILTPSSPPSSPSPSPLASSSLSRGMPSRTAAAAGQQQKYNNTAEAVTARVLYALKFRNMTLLHYPGDHATKQLFHQVYMSH